MSVYRAHVARVQFVIDRKFVDPALTIDAVAGIVGISAQHVCRVLRRERGLTFADLLRDVRLREAQRLLRESSYSMKEIAFRVGFRHPSQFSRAFTGSCGVPPSEYRTQEIAGMFITSKECEPAISVRRVRPDDGSDDGRHEVVPARRVVVLPS